MSLVFLAVMQSALTERTGAVQSPRVLEASGVAVSRAYPGVLWTHNDSGDGPYLYATDLYGSDLGSVRVTDAEALDWEDIAIGPCPTSRATCLFIADVGDNLEVRPFVTVYAVPEPDPPGSARDTARTTRAPAVLRLRYPDGARDVEAIYVAPRDGALFLVSKGRSSPVRVYRVDRGSWTTDTVATATRVQDLALGSRREGGWITAAAIRPDGRLVALRTPTEIYLYTPGVGGRLGPPTWPTCVIRGLEYQGEAVDFLNDSTLVVLSEAAGLKKPGSIHTVRCPPSDYPDGSTDER